MKKILFVLFIISIASCRKDDCSNFVGNWKVKHTVTSSTHQWEDRFFLHLYDDGRGKIEDFAGNTDNVRWINDEDKHLMNIVKFIANEENNIYTSTDIFDIIENQNDYQKWVYERNLTLYNPNTMDTIIIQDTTVWELERQ